MSGDGIFSASSDSRGANGRLLGQASDNPYESRGAGVAPVFQNPDGSRPQDRLQAISVPRWNDQATEGQQNLDALANKNQAQVKQFEGAKNNGGQLRSSTDAGANGNTTAQEHSDHSIQILGIPAAILGASACAQLIHPPLQHALIPGQLKADGLADTGELNKLQKVLQSPRKAFLQAFSSPYLVHNEARQISSAESSLRQNLGTMKQDAAAHIEALQLRGAGLKELKKLASSEPSKSVSAMDIQKAIDQVKYLDDIKSSRTPGQTLASFLPEERARLSFLNRQKDYLPGGVANEAHLNWTQFGESMKKSNAFREHQIQPVMDLAAKEKPYFQLGKMKLAREELQSFSTGMKGLKASDFFEYADMREVTSKLGQKFLQAGLVVGGASAVQLGLSDAFANNQHETLARIVQPTIPGAFLKTTALLCGATPAMKTATFAGAQLYEVESNMTPLERLGTVSVGLLPSALLIARNNRGLALTLGVADLAIGAATQLSSFFNSDFKSGATKQGDDVSKRLASHAQDRSQSTMASDVKWLNDIGRQDPYRLTKISENAHKPESLATPNSTLDCKAEKFRNQMVIGEALGETTLNHGLTMSEYSKLMNPAAPLEVPIDRKEEFQIAPAEHIDIGGRAVLTLMGAIGSANLLESTLAQKPSVNAEEIDAVEKQKKVMVDEVDHLLNDSHAKNFEGVFKDEKYSMFKPTNEYSLIQFWLHDNDKYVHLYRQIRETAHGYYEQLPRMQAALNAAQLAVDDGKANPQVNTSSLANEKMLEARKYAFNTTAALTAKLYRDEALMELAQAECYVADSGKVAGESAKAIQVLGLAATALQNSEQFAPGNADCAVLGADTTAVYQAAKAL